MRKEDKIKLSISLLVSNSIDTIKKCMDSLVPILKAIPSELIVVDTGGTDGSIDIAKQYADLVVPFVWCDDFAKARNAGLQKAKGEWFLFLDDDEWFESVDEIIQFFNSKEYLSYNSASYAIRNYRNKQGTKWSETRYPRMVKLRKETKFVSPIHEILHPVDTPEKYFNCYVHHYGYVFDTEEENRKHTERNINLLKKVLEKDENDHRLKLQLAQEYTAIKEYQISIDISEECIETIKNIPVKLYDIVSYAGWHIKNIIYSEIQRENRKEAYRKAEEFLKMPWINSVTKNNITNVTTRLAHEFGKYEDCIKYLDIYLETYDIIKKDEKRRIRETVSDQIDSYLDDNFFLAILCGILAASKLNDLERKKNYIKRLSTVKFLITDIEDIKEVINGVFRFEEEESINIFGKFLQNDKFRTLLIGMIENEQVEIPRNKLIKVLELYSDKYSEFLPYRILSYHKENRDVKELINIYFEKENNILYPSSEWSDLFINEIDLVEYSEKIQLDQWINNILEFVKKASYICLVKILQVCRNQHKKSVRIQNLMIQCFEKLLINEKINDLTFANVDTLLREYIEVNLSLFTKIYNKDVFNSEMEVFLPDSTRFCYKIKNIYNENTDELSKVRIIRASIDLYPYLSPFCKIYNDKIQEESKKATDEFLQLAEMIKENIRRYIVLGQSETALSTLNQLEQLVPNDPELLELKKMLM